MPRPINRRRAGDLPAFVRSLPEKSPFQRMLKARMAAKKLSFRDLGKIMGIPPTNIFSWSTCVRGYPSPRSFNRSHIAPLAMALGVAESDLKAALDASRDNLSDLPKRAPAMQEAFHELLTVLESWHKTRRRVTSREVFLLADRLYKGALWEESKAPGATP